MAVDYFGRDDLIWLQALIDEFHAGSGGCERQLDERLRQPLPVRAPFAKRAVATEVMRRLWRSITRSAVPPRRARERVFQAAAAAAQASRQEIILREAQRLGVEADEISRALFADIPGERIVEPPGTIPSPGEVGLRANLMVAQHLLVRSASLRISVEGNARAVVRLAKLRGLICTVRSEDRTLPVLELSGPLSLFRRTLLYGRSLAELLPLLAWCPRYRLDATCFVRGLAAELVLSTGAPIFPGEQPRRFDSQLEERFARDFARATPDWDLVREPEPLQVGTTLIFPDFLLRHRGDPGRRWYLEIVGFWTPEYLERKLAAFRAASLDNLVLCVDEGRNCSEAELPPGANLIRFSRRIDPAAVLNVVGSQRRRPD